MASHLDLDRHARDGNRRGVDAVLCDPRARAADEHQRARSPASGSSRATSGSAACARTCRAASTRRSTRSSIAFPSKIDEFEGLLTKNDIFLRRTEGVGVRHAGRRARVGTGRARSRAASGSDYDVRKYFPYTAVRDLRLQGADRDRRRRLRALPRARRGDAAEREDLRSRRSSASRRPASGPATTRASCRRRRTRSTRRWRR